MSATDPPPPPDPQALTATFAQLGARTRSLLDTALKNAFAQPFTIPDRAAVAKAMLALGGRLLADPGRLAEAQMAFTRDLQELQQRTLQRLAGAPTGEPEPEPVIEPEPGDRRFSDERWRSDPRFDYIKQYYLLAARSILTTVRSATGLDPKTAAQAEFYTRQYLDAMAPTNVALLNPKVLQEIQHSNGQNLLKGMDNLLADLDRGRWRAAYQNDRHRRLRLGRKRRRHPRPGGLPNAADAAHPVPPQHRQGVPTAAC